MTSRANFCFRSIGSKKCKWCFVDPIKTRQEDSWCQNIFLVVEFVLKPVIAPSSSKFDVKILILLLAVHARKIKIHFLIEWNLRLTLLGCPQ